MAYQLSLNTCSIVEENPMIRIMKDTYVRSEEEENREEAAVSCIKKESIRVKETEDESALILQ